MWYRNDGIYYLTKNGIFTTLTTSNESHHFSLKHFYGWFFLKVSLSQSGKIIDRKMRRNGDRMFDFIIFVPTSLTIAAVWTDETVIRCFILIRLLSCDRLLPHIEAKETRNHREYNSEKRSSMAVMKLNLTTR